MPAPRKRPPRPKKKRQSRGPERRQFVNGEARALPGRRSVDQELHESHALLHAAIEGSPDLIFLKNLEGRYLMINSAAARQWGHSVAQVLGKTDAELYPQEIARMFRKRDQHVLSTGQTITFEDFCSMTEGARTFLVTKGLLRDQSGKPVGVFGIGRDTTESNRAQEALRKSEESFRQLFANNPQSMCVYDRESLRFLEVNDAAIAHYGYSREELLAMSITDIYHPEDIPRLRRRLAEQRSELRASEGWRHRLKDGRIIDVETASHTITFAGRLAVLATAQDVTERKRAEDALRKSESHLRAILDTEPECVKRVAADGTLLEMNPAGLAMIEADNAEQVFGRNIYPLVVPEHRDAFRELTERVCRGERGTLDFEIVGLKGTRRYLETHAVPLRRESTGAIELLGVTRDITERKRAESQMRLQAAALESAANAILITDRDGHITWVNPSFTRLTGFTAEEVMGENPRILKSGQQESAFYRQMWQTMLAGNVWRGEVINKRKDGTLYNEDMTITPVHDSSGKIRHFVAIKQDVTSQKEAEVALRQSEARLRGLFENATLGVYRSTQEGRFLDVNPALVSMLGYNSQEELLAVSIAENVYANPADRDRLVKEYAGAETFTNVPLQWRRKDGKPISVRLSGRAVRDARDAFECFEIFVEDVTERQAIEKQFYAAQKFEAIGYLAGGVAHDFNNVLGAIIGWAELCLDSASEDPKLRKGLGVIIEQANHAVGLTRQLLAFARRQHMEPRVINLNNSVREISTLLGSVIGRDIELKTLLAPDVFSTLADPTHVEQVLMNLCVNARDAMPHGGKLIIETKNAEVDEDYCRWHPYAQPGRYVQLSVSDSGVGIDSGTLDHIFEPFFTTKELGKGTGLGLATVYGIAKQHGGFIHAYSEVGQGTTFHIYFPASAVTPMHEMRAEAPALRGGSETILIAEDNEDLAELACAALQGMGYSVLRARDGEDAVAQFELHRDRIALLVFDVVMPKLNGPDAYVKIRAIQENVPVLFISGHSFESPALSSFVERGAELLQKPYSTKALLLKVRALLDRK